MEKRNNSFESCLIKVPIFSTLKEEEQAQIASLIKPLKLKKGEYVYAAGDVRDALFIVHEGKVRISRLGPSGDEQVLRILNPGDFIGERALFNIEEAKDFATAIEDSHICVIQASDLLVHMEKHPQIMFSVMKELSGRLQKAETLIESTNLLPVEERIATALLNLKNNQNIVVLPYSKTDWASMLGMKKETLSRKLKEFKDFGYISLIGQRKIIIEKPEVIRKISKI